MNMRADEDNGKSVGMVKFQARKLWIFSSKEFWKNIYCLVSDTNFGLGESRLWDKETQKIIRKKSGIHSIRVKVNLYEIFAYPVLFDILFIVL